MRSGILALSLALFLTGSSVAAEKSEFEFDKQSGIQQVKPKKPVKIKLRRTPKGEYTWDLSGDDVEEVVKADARLRKLLKIQ